MKITGLQEFVKSVKNKDGALFIACGKGMNKEQLINVLSMIRTEIALHDSRVVGVIACHSDYEIELVKVWDGEDE